VPITIESRRLATEPGSRSNEKDRLVEPGAGSTRGTEGGGALHLLPQLRLDDLLDELQARLQMVLATRDRMHGLLDAVVAIGSELNLEVVLRRIVEAAVTLVDARYGALGVIGEGQEGKLLAEFIPVGVTEAEIAGIDHWPEGHGILGLLVRDPGALRLSDLSQHPASSGFPAGHPKMNSFLGVTVRVRGEVFGNLYLTEKRGASEFTEDDEAVLAALGAAAGVAVENARLYDEARRQQRWLRASSEVSIQLLSGTDPRQVLASMTGQALELSGADLAVLALPTEEGDRLVIEYASGDGAGGVHGLVLPSMDSLSGRVYGNGEALNVDDFAADPRTADALRGPMGHLGPAVVFPLGVPGNVRGVLTVGRRRGGHAFPEAAVDVVASFAAQAGIALELADRRYDEERLSLYEDRDRIARDLHDLVIQRLYATGMSLEGSMPLVTRPELRDRVRHAVDAMDDTIKDIRGTIFALQSRGDGKGPGLRSQVLGIVDDMTEMLGFSPAVRLGSGLDGHVTDAAATELLAALREALSNAARHSGADSVDVSVEADEDLVLRVTDDGTGIPAGAHRSGLANLAKRADRMGGSLRVGDAPVGRRAGEAASRGSAGARRGTELVWQVPLR
jgi:two-component system, NarL family, sensor histidine kinase DevS